MMKTLGTALPLTGMQHVKRVRKSTKAPGKLEIVLCPVAAGPSAAEQGVAGPDGQAAPPALPPVVEALVKEHNLELFVAQVRKTAWGALAPAGRPSLCSCALRSLRLGRHAWGPSPSSPAPAFRHC
jgi:hypothetical protein